MQPKVCLNKFGTNFDVKAYFLDLDISVYKEANIEDVCYWLEVKGMGNGFYRKNYMEQVGIFYIIYPKLLSGE